tara:strand:+ start:801 stop:1208 length:408 start_codon:yes stop_codon:yes gene_type:complete
MNSRYSLAICELFSPTKHGKTENSSANVDGQWLIYLSIPLDEFYDGSYYEDIEFLSSQNIDARHEIKLDIICVDELEYGGEFVGYIQTQWLKIIQRKWKRIMKHRNSVIQKRRALKTLRARQQTGAWPKGLCNWQ